MVSLGGDVDDDLGVMMIMMIMTMIIEVYILRLGLLPRWVLFRLVF